MAGKVTELLREAIDQYEAGNTRRALCCVYELTGLIIKQVSRIETRRMA